ncbi:MAG TPA: polyprenyl diphosphate synthase [Candidatus Saccharimonadia bacterium]|nr:polyprenyl diphosphate synthase [Candidatus Saccharimonadia bacterium]
MAKSNTLPTHLGLIIDGNRRWARENNLTSLLGHKKGYDNLKKIAKYAIRKGVKYVSAYIFSVDNWNRSPGEVKYLMNLTKRLLKKDVDELDKENIKVVWLGSREKVDKQILKDIEIAEEKTKNNTKGTLGLCFNYSGHQEIIDAVNKLVKKGLKDKVTKDLIEENLYGDDIPALDLVIRTSGEQRISNFMLWRIAYAELYFTNKKWPEFSEKDLDVALSEYAKRNRRFGA